MKCPKCGAELPKNAEACPKCGARMGKKKLSRGATIAITVVLVALVAAAFVALILRHNRTAAPTPDTNAVGQTSESSTQTPPATTQTPSTQTPVVTNPVTSFTPEEGVYTYPAASVSDEMLDQIVAVDGDRTLNNRQLPFYYWYGIQNFYSANSAFNISQFLDLSKPLTEQYYDEDEGITWQKYFLDMAISDFDYYAALNQAAQAEKFALPEVYETYFDNLIDSTTAAAVNYGYKDLESYLQAFFSPYATADDYLEFTKTYMTANAYVAELQSRLSCTEEEIEAYYEEHKDEFESNNILQDGTRLVNVRHILLQPSDTEDEDEWAAALQDAEDILETWKNNPTEDYFAQLANNYSVDPGSNTTGGLYENVYPHQMVQEFNDWCFDASRQIGDTGIVRTSYGYHIMYYAGQGDEYWSYMTRNALLSSRYSEQEQQILDSYESKTYYENVVLVDPVGMY